MDTLYKIEFGSAINTNGCSAVNYLGFWANCFLSMTGCNAIFSGFGHIAVGRNSGVEKLNRFGFGHSLKGCYHKTENSAINYLEFRALCYLYITTGFRLKSE